MTDDENAYAIARSHERFDVKLVVRTHGEDGEEHLGLESRNLSLGGAFLYTKPYMPTIGTNLTLDLSLPDDKQGTLEISIRGTVVHWIQRGGIGIRFDKDNPAKTMKVLKKYLDQLKKAHN